MRSCTEVLGTRVVFVLLPLVLLPARAAAQSVTDSVRVVMTIWDSAVGTPPYQHPAGTARSVCIEPEQSALSPTATVLQMLRDTVSRHLRMRVAPSCRSMSSPTSGGWIVDDEDS